MRVGFNNVVYTPSNHQDIMAVVSNCAKKGITAIVLFASSSGFYSANFEFSLLIVVTMPASHDGVGNRSDFIPARPKTKNMWGRR